MPHFQGLAHYGLAGIAFQWVILTFALFRVTRFVTTDSFPPMAATRKFIIKRYLKKHWSELIVCNWCVGFYICALAYFLTAQMFSVPLPVIQAAATMGLVGFIGNFDE